jgi:O-antigen/teichoic acid export membrane protein
VTAPVNALSRVGAGRKTLISIAHLGSGEFVARLCAIATLGILGHRYGAAVVGIFALAQGVAQYLQPLIDFGMRHTGARLVARYPGAIATIVRVVQTRRRMMLCLALPIVAAYVLALRVDSKYKMFVLGFAACACPYAFSVDWLAWGKEKFKLVAVSRAVVPAAILIFLLASWSSPHPLGFVFAGHAFGQILLVIAAWVWWKSAQKQSPSEAPELPEIQAALRFRRTALLGLALFSNLAFNTIDVLLLGIYATPSEVGLYSASYRVLNQALVIYYLLTQSLYPQFARLLPSERSATLRPSILTVLFTCGASLTLLTILGGEAILRLLFGAEFAVAYSLLAILACAIPIDFLTSNLSNAYIAWGMERQVLVCTATGAVTNIGLNVAFMPIYGAKAAAINTVVSYIVFLTSLIIVRSGVARMALESSLVSQISEI